jgi:ketosteroid isomerase-like protein
MSATQETDVPGGNFGTSLDNQLLLTRQGIQNFNESVALAFRSKDAVTMASFWTENARLLPPGEEMLTGRDAVQAFWRRAFDQGAYDVVLESIEIGPMGNDAAYEVGRNVVKVRLANGSSIDVPGKSLCIFRREADNVWRADVDIFNALPS